MDTEPQTAPSSAPAPPETPPSMKVESPEEALSVAPGVGAELQTVTTPILAPTTPEAHLTATGSRQTSPIAKAIRDEIRTLADVEVLELQVLEALVKVARSGRDLMAVRNPIMRFDAKAQGLEGQNDPCAMPNPGVGFICGPDDMEDYDHWDGPAIRGASDRRKKEIEDALRRSPLATAVKAELLELAKAEPFGPSELVQVEQLATHAHHLLSAALGLPTNVGGPQGRGNRRYMGSNLVGSIGYGGNLMSPYSSPETFGAKMSREMIAASGKPDPVDPEKLVLAIASARQNGLDDVAAKLEGQLGIQPTPPSKPPTTGGA